MALAAKTSAPAPHQAAPSRSREGGRESSASAEFVDNRPGAAVQRKLADMIVQSPRSVAQARFVAGIDASARQLSASTAGKGESPAQRKTITVGSGGTQTKVDWAEGNLKGSGEPVGMGMAAKNLHRDNVDEGDLIGSTPRAAAQKNLMAQLPTAPKNKSTDKYIKGHLLNHNVGGPGEDFNMFPITASANSLHHSFVERTVKQWVNKDKQRVDYSVNVKNVNDHSDGAAKAGYVNSYFDCQAKNLDTNDTLSAQIHSNFGIKATAASTKFVGVNIDLADDNHNFAEGSLLGQLYAKIKDVDDQEKVDIQISIDAGLTVDRLKLLFASDKVLVGGFIQEVAGTKGKRFTNRMEAALNDAIVEIMEVFVAKNDKSGQGDLEGEYPTLTAWLKK